MTFHDPSTREMMEREGWEYMTLFLARDAGFDTTLDPSVQAYCKDNGDFYEIHILESNVLVLDFFDKGAVELPMKSFSAAKEAADAILRGVEG